MSGEVLSCDFAKTGFPDVIAAFHTESIVQFWENFARRNAQMFCPFDVEQLRSHLCAFMSRHGLQLDHASDRISKHRIRDYLFALKLIIYKDFVDFCRRINATT